MMNDMDHLLAQKTTGRVVNYAQTYKRVLPILDLIGASSLIDLTGHSALSIPVYAVSVEGYTAYGKGIDPIQAQVSAMMETIERYTARRLPPNAILATSTDMRQIYHKQILEPEIIGLDAISDVPLEWLPGVDLVSNTMIWIPAYYVVLADELVGPPLLELRTTNGIASGNTFDEAVCHGLYEVIERDAWTLAWVQSVTHPQMKYIAKKINHGTSLEWDDTSFSPKSDNFPLIHIESLPKNAKILTEIFKTSKMHMVIRNITSDVGIPTFIAACNEKTRNYYGLGTHLNSEIAVIRAITECAQVYHANKLNQSNNKKYYVDTNLEKMLFSPSKYIDFDKIKTYKINNLQYSIKIIIDLLIKSGLEKIISVNITHPKLGIPVVRILVPGIESWCVHNFSPNHCHLGYRGLKYINKI